MKYPPSFFRDGLPEWKRKKDPVLSRVFYRPVSFLFSSLFCEMGLSANAVSYLSALVGVAACACFVAGLPVVGAVLVNVWLVLDCSDGNIARLVRKERFGDFADSLSSYICVGLMFPCVGFCCYQTGGVLFAAGSPWVILIGALASSSDSLTRLAYQKYLNSSFRQGEDSSVGEDGSGGGRLDRVRIKVDSYLSLGGLLPAALLVAAIAGALDVVVCAWAVYYGAVLIASVLYLIRKTVIANREDAEHVQ